MRKIAIFLGLCILVAGCAGLRACSFRGLEPGLPKAVILRAWGQPTVIPRTLKIRDGTVMEIYQYERGRPRDIYTLYFRQDRLWYWDKRDWRGSSASERLPAR